MTKTKEQRVKPGSPCDHDFSGVGHKQNCCVRCGISIANWSSTYKKCVPVAAQPTGPVERNHDLLKRLAEPAVKPGSPHQSVCGTAAVNYECVCTDTDAKLLDRQLAIIRELKQSKHELREQAIAALRKHTKAPWRTCEEMLDEAYADAQPAGPAEEVTWIHSLAEELVSANNDKGRSWDNSPNYEETVFIINKHALRAGNEQKIRDYVLAISGVPIDANTDPVDFILASHAALRSGTDERGREALEDILTDIEWLRKHASGRLVKYDEAVGDKLNGMRTRVRAALRSREGE